MTHELSCCKYYRHYRDKQLNTGQKPKASEWAFKNVQKRVYSYGTWLRSGCQRSVTAGGKVLFDCCPIVNEHILTVCGKQGLLE